MSQELYNTLIRFTSLERETLNSLEIYKKSSLPEEEAQFLLSKSKDNFCFVFYYLSENSRVLNRHTFRNSFLKENLKFFSEEELYYLYEGMKNQLQKFDDFYLLFHHFLIHLNRRTFQNLLLSILSDPGYKANEIIISQNLLIKITENINIPTIFHLKAIQSIVNNEMVKKYVTALNLKLHFKQITGCKTFFKHWYCNLKIKTIEIVFED